MRRRAMASPMRPSPMNPTFMNALRSNELAAHPVELAADVIDDVAALEALGQHVPGVGLHFEMARQRLCLVEAQRLGDGEPRGAERAEIVEENRDVNVGAPLARPRILLERGDGVVDIEEAVELAVSLFQGLRQVDGLGVTLE